jgi:hypothetical protein
LSDIERKWIKQLQRLLNKCPSKRLKLVTGGDRDLAVVDNTHPDHEEWYDFEFNGGQLADISFNNGPQICGMCK